MEHMPTPSLLVVTLFWAVPLGIWIEQRRRGGSFDLEAQRDQVVTENAELLTEIDELVTENQQLREQIEDDRRAAMARHPSATATAERLQLVIGGRT